MAALETDWFPLICFYIETQSILLKSMVTINSLYIGSRDSDFYMAGVTLNSTMQNSLLLHLVSVQLKTRAEHNC